MNGGTNSDFAFKTDEWGQTISNLTEANKAMNDTADEMRETVRNALLQAGLSGETAEALAEQYDREILSSVRQFDNDMKDYIAVNQKNLDAAEQMSQETNRIANTSL